jgi:hypothetical protein
MCYAYLDVFFFFALAPSIGSEERFHYPKSVGSMHAHVSQSRENRKLPFLIESRLSDLFYIHLF